MGRNRTQPAARQSQARRPSPRSRLTRTRPLWALTASTAMVAAAGAVVAWLVLGQSPRVWAGSSVYGALVASWLLMQIAFAHAEHARQREDHAAGSARPVTVVIPTYNESEEIARACVQSVLDQTYEGHIQAIVIDDGSAGGGPHLDDLRPIPEGNRCLELHRLVHNRGKRHAQAVGFRDATGDFIATVDSDTCLDAGAIAAALEQFDTPRVGAVTGVALVANRVNVLTRLVGLRYWSAFHQERASQSLLGVVMCCTGVFSIYRRTIIASILDRYVKQRFLGKPCHYGDDRHLTNLILRQGYQVRLATKAVAWTQAPTRLGMWLRQQLRWSKSFYREFIWSLGFAHRRNAYFAYCLLFQAALPLLLVYGLGRGAVFLISGHPEVALRYGFAVTIMAWLRGAYGLWRTHDLEFLLMPVYGFLHVFLVLPVRLFALFTLWDNRWGTR